PFPTRRSSDLAFAVVGRQAGNAQVDELAGDLRLDAAVLRDALLGDGHVRLDLQSRNDRRLQSFGRRALLVQHAVNAVTHAERLAHRLEVNVRGAHPEGLDNQPV